MRLPLSYRPWANVGSTPASPAIGPGAGSGRPCEQARRMPDARSQSQRGSSWTLKIAPEWTGPSTGVVSFSSPLGKVGMLTVEPESCYDQSRPVQGDEWQYLDQCVWLNRHKSFTSGEEVTRKQKGTREGRKLVGRSLTCVTAATCPYCGSSPYRIVISS